MSDSARLVLDVRDTVGESLVWDDQQACLYWVDIIGKRIHRFEPSTGMHQSFETPDFVTSIGLRADGGFVVGLTKKVTLWDGESDFRTLAFIEPDNPANRLNEGVVGPDGGFWVGTMQNNIAADGSPSEITASAGRLYRVKLDGSVTRVAEELFGITNTMAWTSDGRFLTADTLANEIYCYPVAPDGTLGTRQTILADYPRGLPDGSALDSDGFLWNCRVVGGACLIRLSVDGAVERVLDLPCTWPTSCAFGGPDLSTLFVSSARFTMTESHLAQNPQEGGLFAVTTPFRGRKSHRMS